MTRAEYHRCTIRSFVRLGSEHARTCESSQNLRQPVQPCRLACSSARASHAFPECIRKVYHNPSDCTTLHRRTTHSEDNDCKTLSRPLQLKGAQLKQKNTSKCNRSDKKRRQQTRAVPASQFFRCRKCASRMPAQDYHSTVASLQKVTRTGFRKQW
jgi:hypothetical protein